MNKSVVCVLAMAVASFGCSKKEKETKKEEVDINNAAAAMGKAMNQLVENSKTAAAKGVVDFHEMKELLPKELPGGFKGELKGSKSGAMGMSVSEVEGQYHTENGESSISIKMTDMSGTGFGALAHAAWASVDVDNESDDEYEKTTKIDGNKALEKYNKKDKYGSIQIIVDGRISVEVTGSNVKMEQIKGALEAVDLKKLTALKPVAPSA